jgi:hypothetical protein
MQEGPPLEVFVMIVREALCITGTQGGIAGQLAQAQARVHLHVSVCRFCEANALER